MVRCTVVEAAGRIPMLLVEGRLVGDWGQVLEAEVERLIGIHQCLSLDLTDVTIVDRAAVATLRRLQAKGVNVEQGSSLIRELLKEGAP